MIVAPQQKREDSYCSYHSSTETRVASDDWSEMGTAGVAAPAPAAVAVADSAPESLPAPAVGAVVNNVR